jgi:hypothetical protein
VGGEILAQGESRQLAPMTDSDSKDVVENSTRLLQKAGQAYSSEKRVLQRQTLKCIVCTECSIDYNGKTTKFWVYGAEKKVHYPEYPGGCCCTII